MLSRQTEGNISLSLLGMGMMRLPCKNPREGEQHGEIDYAAAQQIIDYAYAHGVTYYDTAYMYHGGESEVFVGKALRKYPRNTFLVADKLPIWMCETENDMERIFHEQLQRTGFDYFDYYLLHALDGKAFEKCTAFGAYEFLLQKQAEGKIRKIGFSFHGSVEELKTIIATHSWDFVQIQLNYLDWEDQAAKTQYEVIRAAGLPVIIMEPVRGGKLANPGEQAEAVLRACDPQRSIASWAIRFAASLPGVITVLSGMSTLSQVEDNVKTLTDHAPLTQAEYTAIEKAATAIRSLSVIPCTGCDYCADCPQGLRPSEMIALYNRYLSGELSADDAAAAYRKIEKGITACVKCGACASHCPQSIEIPKLLQGDIRKVFERS